MARYSVAEARNTLPRLIDKSLAGEEVVIARRGREVVRLSPVTAAVPPDEFTPGSLE